MLVPGVLLLLWEEEETRTNSPHTWDAHCCWGSAHRVRGYRLTPGFARDSSNRGAWVERVDSGALGL